MIRLLQPWFVNIQKRQVKSPKLYFRDSGLFHYLLGLKNKTDLLIHPKLGASWEGFALEEVIRFHQAEPGEAYFWAVHTQGEIDLLLFKEGRRLGFEFKYKDAPTLTKSMILSLETLELDTLTLLYPGQKEYSLTEKIHVKPLESYLSSSPRKET